MRPRLLSITTWSVDTDKDGKISQAEFQDGCAKGWIQKADASTIKDMKSDRLSSPHF
jgi:hypothetical protein